MAAIDTLEIVVDVDIGSALAALEDLQDELRDLAEQIEEVDSTVGEDGIDVRTSLDELEDELTELRAEIEAFEATNSVRIPVFFERSELDRLENSLDNLGSRTISPTISVDDDALAGLQEDLSSLSADLGLDEFGDGTLVVDSMDVTAARVNVVGAGGGDMLADALGDMEFDADDIDTGDDFLHPDDDPTMLFGTGPESGRDATRRRDFFRGTFASDEELFFGMRDLFGDEEGHSLIPFDPEDVGNEGFFGDADMPRPGDVDADDVTGAAAIAETLSAEIEDAMTDEGVRTADLRQIAKSDMDADADVIGRQLRAGNIGLMDALGDTIGGADFDFSDMFDRGRDRSRVLRRLSDSVSGAMDSIRNFDLRMSDIHNLLARIVPLLLVMIGALPAVITAVLGLAAAAVTAAAALAAIAGFGALGVALEDGEIDMENLQEIMQQIQDDFIEAFAPLAERLQPVFEDAADGLTRLFESIANQDDALLTLVDEARAFGGFIMDFVPTMLRTLSGLVEALAPVLADVGRVIDAEFANVTRDIVELTRRTVPIVAELALQIGRALPAIVAMSIGFAQVANAIVSLLGFVGSLLGMLGITPELFGLLTASVLGAATAILVLRSQIVMAIAQAFVGLVRTIAGAVLPVMSAYTSSNLVAAGATIALTAAIVTLLSVVTLGVFGVVAGAASTMATEFLGVADSVDQATQSLQAFDRVSSNVDGGAPNPYGTTRPTDANLGGQASTGVTVIEDSDAEQGRSNATYASWRQGRTTGSDP
jgi:hypothetical protein